MKIFLKLYLLIIAVNFVLKAVIILNFFRDREPILCLVCVVVGCSKTDKLNLRNILGCQVEAHEN